MTKPIPAAEPSMLKTLALRVEDKEVTTLKPYERNARTHSRKQVSQIAASIRQFGFNNPVLIDEEDRMIAGHGRVEAAKLIGMKTVPTIRLDHLSPGERRAYIIADNRLAELAGWDTEILKIELQAIEETDLDFEIEITGFDTADIDVMIDGKKPVSDPRADEIPELQSTAVSRLHDLWLLGEHRLLCGDARKPEDYAKLMDGELARMVFADPPYNVAIQGNVGGLGKVKHREFVMASGEMSTSEFTAFLTDCFGCMAEASCDGSIHLQCMDWRHMGEVLQAGSAAYSELKNLIVWAKNNGGMGTFYRSQHELIFVFKKGAVAHLNTFGLGEKGRYRTNIWTYPGINTFRAGRDEELAMHPTVKPTALVADAIKDVSRRGDIVLDAFGGSGTTLIAAQKTKR